MRFSPVSTIRKALYQDFNLTATSVTRLKAGVMNVNFLVKTAQENFVLRVYGQKTEPETRLERLMLATLSKKGFPCPAPRKALDGHDTITLAGRPAILYTMLPGTSKRTATPSQMHELGRLQGIIHATFLKTVDPTKKPGWDPADVKRLLTEWRPKIERSRFPQAKPFLDFIDGELAICHFPKTLPTGLTHQDIKPENTLFQRGQVSGVLDFDNCYHGALLHDLTTTIIWWCFPREKLSLPLVEAFLQGYDAERKLTKAEHRLLLGDGLKFRLLREMFIGPMTTLANIPLAVERASRFERCYKNLFPSHTLILGKKKTATR